MLQRLAFIKRKFNLFLEHWQNLHGKTRVKLLLNDSIQVRCTKIDYFDYYHFRMRIKWTSLLQSFIQFSCSYLQQKIIIIFFNHLKNKIQNKSNSKRIINREDAPELALFIYFFVLICIIYDKFISTTKQTMNFNSKGKKYKFMWVVSNNKKNFTFFWNAILVIFCVIVDLLLKNLYYDGDSRDFNW